MNEKLHKHQCAVRQMLQYRHKWGLAQFQQYISKPSVYGLWLDLMDDFSKQWSLGNRGEKGNWIE